jgi:hypothetical protein
MFQLLNSHFQAYSLQVKSQDVMYTLESQCVYISEIFKPYHLPRRVKPVKNRPEDDYLSVETCSLHITLCTENQLC